MKKLIFSIFIIFIYHNISQAEVSRRRYKLCWFGTKYKTSTSVYPWANFGGSLHNWHNCDNCSGCYSESPSIGAWAWAESNSSKYWSLFKVWDKQWRAGKSPYRVLANYYQQSSPSSSFKLKNGLLLQSPPPPEYDGIEAKDSSANVEFDTENRTITLTDYFANLRIHQDTVDLYYVNLTIQGVYNKQGDANEENDSIFHTINVYMEGSNEIDVTGIDPEDFNQSINTNEVICNYVGGDLVINVPSYMDFDEVGVAITIDGGPVASRGGGEPFILAESKNKSSFSGFELRNIFPNPSINLLNINIHSAKKLKVSISIIDVLGQELFFEKEVLFYQGNNLKQLSSEALKPGTYFLVINDGENKYQIKFLKEY